MIVVGRVGPPAMTVTGRAGLPAMTVTRADCAGLEVLGELEPSLLARVATECRIVTFHRQDVILQQGADNAQVHFVLSGRVHLYFDSATQSQPIEIGAGRMFGEMSVIGELPVWGLVGGAATC